METYLRQAQVQDSIAVCDKAREFAARIEASSLRLKAGASAKPFVCIELACLEVKREYSREFSAKLSGTNLKTYSRVFNSIVKTLGITSTLNIQYLCSIFGYDELIERFLPIEREFKAKRPEISQDLGVVAGAVFISCCFVGKLSMDRKKVAYFTLGTLKQLEDLADEILKELRPLIERQFHGVKDEGGFIRKRKESPSQEQDPKISGRKKRILYSMVFPWKGFQSSQAYSAFSNWKNFIFKGNEEYLGQK